MNYEFHPEAEAEVIESAASVIYAVIRDRSMFSRLRMAAASPGTGKRGAQRADTWGGAQRRVTGLIAGRRLTE